MHLQRNSYPNETTLQKLISGSPVLEDLTIIKYPNDDKANVLQVRSHTLKRVHINECAFVIDAPLLQCLKAAVSSTKNFQIINLGFSAKLVIDIPFFGDATYSSSTIRDILTDIARVKELVFRINIWKEIFQYSKWGPVLQFRDLSRLNAKFSKIDLEMLPTILESCPKLKHFVLELVRDRRMLFKKNREPKVMFTTVPRCLVSSLRFLEWKRSISWYEGEAELVRYFLKNSTILEKLRLDVYYTEKAKCDFLKEVLTMPRCSSIMRCVNTNKWSQKDMISQLPDHLICHILDHLPTKEAIKTSVLSTRWTSLWLGVLVLDLDSNKFSNFNAFASFADRVFYFHKESCIRKLQLTINNNHDAKSPLSSWIDTVTTRTIQHLHVRVVSCSSLHEMPLSLYTSNTLVHLRLFGVTLLNAEFVSLSCLKMMHLKYVYYPNEATLEKLVSSSPVLEDLSIIRCSSDHNGNFSNNAKVLQLRSRTLKRIYVNMFAQVVIDAPLLKCLRVKLHLIKSFRIICSDFSAQIQIGVNFGSAFNPYHISERRAIHNVLTDISRIKDLVISSETWKVIYKYSKVELLPQFSCMFRLSVTLCVSDLEWLSTFLKSCPNLKSLILVWYGYFEKMFSEEMNSTCFSSVPECLLSSLEFVDIKHNNRRCATEMELVKYFLEKSRILKKLTLRLHENAMKDVIFKEILRIPRSSVKCQVLLL